MTESMPRMNCAKTCRLAVLDLQHLVQLGGGERVENLAGNVAELELRAPRFQLLLQHDQPSDIG